MKKPMGRMSKTTQLISNNSKESTKGDRPTVERIELKERWRKSDECGVLGRALNGNTLDTRQDSELRMGSRNKTLTVV